MSRAVIFNKLTTDTGLLALGINSNTVFPNWSFNEAPTRSGPFIVLRWEENSSFFQEVSGPRVLTVWVHYPVEVSTDFNKIDTILDAVDSVLLPLTHVVGTDGKTLTCVRGTGRSGDFKDDGFQTITRNAGYEVLYR